MHASSSWGPSCSTGMLVKLPPMLRRLLLRPEQSPAAPAAPAAAAPAVMPAGKASAPKPSSSLLLLRRRELPSTTDRERTSGAGKGRFLTPLLPLLPVSLLLRGLLWLPASWPRHLCPVGSHAAAPQPPALLLLGSAAAALAVSADASTGLQPAAGAAVNAAAALGACGTSAGGTKGLLGTASCSSM